MVRSRTIVAGVGCGAAVALIAAGPARRHRIGARLRYLAGRLAGIEYHLQGGHPDENVGDLVLADRIRSTIGRLEHSLDQPRIHVTVYQHVATLHGDVATEYAAGRLVDAVRSVFGVAGVRSRLHIGLVPGDSCPSAALEA